jgi:serine/threonine protein kinase
MAGTKWTHGDEIGRGGYAVVRRATREDDGQVFAAKHLGREWCKDPKAVQRFRHEVAFQRLLEHPNIMPVIATSLKGSHPWFVMPLMIATLQDEIDADINAERAEEVLTKVLSAVGYAHSRRILHRDLKPGNILIDATGEPIVSDFGLGKNLASDSTAVTTTAVGVGTYVYSAPEQIIDLRAADARSDIYSIGKILQAMVTHALPLQFDDPRVPKAYRHFIAKCTDPSSDARYQTVADVVSAFAQVRAGVETPEAPREEFKRLVSEWQELPEGDDLAALDDLDGLLNRNAENREFYQEVVPQIPVEMIEQYIARRPSAFRRLFRAYDGHVAGGLDFDYCDIVADFYERVIGRSEDRTVRRIALSRLLHVGRSHNRWHVGQVTGRVFATLGDESDVLMAVELINEQSEDAAWCIEWTKDLAVPAALRDALRMARDAHPT